MAIAVMLAEMPRLLRDVLATSLSDEPAIRVVDAEHPVRPAARQASGGGAFPSPDDVAPDAAPDAASDAAPDAAPEMALVERLDAVRPDVLVVGLPGDDARDDALDDALQACATVLGRFPAMKVFALEELGRRVSLYELRPTRTALGTLSPAELADAICRAVRPMPIAPQVAPHVHVVIGPLPPPQRGGGGG